MHNVRVYALVLVYFGCLEQLSAQTVRHSPVLGDVLEYPTSGCDGAVVQTPLPGKQFNFPANATGLAGSIYAEIVARHVTWSTSMECTHTDHTHALVPAPDNIQNAGINNGYTSGNWSGYQISNSAQYTQVSWTIPTVVKPSPAYSTDGNYYSSTWTGVGGAFGANPPGVVLPLIQAGTTQQFLTTGNQYYFWYEIVGGPTDTMSEVRISKAVKAGDSAYTFVAWTPVTAFPGYGTVQFWICNMTSNNCTSFVKGDSGNLSTLTPQPGKSTEWIVEAQAVNNKIAPLADFDHVYFTSAIWSATWPNNPNNHSIAQGLSPAKISLVSYVFQTNQTIAAPDALMNNGLDFIDYYLQPVKSGPTGP